MLVEAAVVDRAGGVEEAHFDRQGVVGEHEAGGGAGDGKDLGGAAVAEAEADGRVEAGVRGGDPVVGVGPDRAQGSY